MAPWLCLSLLLSAGGVEPRLTLDLSGRWELARAGAEAAAEWATAPVPSAWESSLGLDFDGVATYRRRVTVPVGQARYVLRLWAAATEATVLCDGREVGRHLGGWTPFDCDLTGRVKIGRASCRERV